MSHYSAGEIRDASRLVTEMRAGRRLTTAEMDFAELALRQEYFESRKREDAAAAFAGPRRAVRDDIPTVEEIERRFGITHPWDLTPEERSEAAIDATLQNLGRAEATRNADTLAELLPRETSRGDDVLMRTDPQAWIEGIQREQERAELDNLLELAAMPEVTREEPRRT